eukprot:jgi/Mesvir1/2057/Mv02317-RA.1
MFTRSSQIDLEQVMGIPGVGAQVMGHLPIPDRVRLRRTCRTFLSAADESLLSVTQLFGEDVAADCKPGGTGLAWLLAKCPNLDTISVASREEHRETWQERTRDRFTLRWTRVMRTEEVDALATGLLCLDELATRYPGLVYLNLAGCDDVTDEGLMAVAVACRGLQALDVSGCDIDDGSVLAVAQSCRALKRLAVAHCEWVTDASLVALSQHSPQLEELDVEHTCVTNNGLATLAQACSRLVRLRAPYGATDASILQVVEHCPRLEQLSVPYCHSVTDACMRRIVARCPRFQRLDARGCYKVTDEGITVLAGGCPGLVHLDLAEGGVSDEGLMAVAEHCVTLEYLDVSRSWTVTDAGIQAIASKCPRLRCLMVEKCQQVTGACIYGVAEKCPRLQKLSIHAAAEQGVVLPSACVRAIASCHELRHVGLAGFHMWAGDELAPTGGDSLAALAGSCPQLEHLDVSSLTCPGAEGAVLAIARLCPRLRVIIAEGMPLSEETVLALIMARGPQLKCLDLRGSALTDATMRVLAQACPRLQELLVGNCEQVTDEGAQLVARACNEMRYLSFDGCCRVTAAGVASIDKERCHVAGIQ